MNVPGFPRHARALGASRRRAGLPASASLDIFWLKDEALEDSANLPAPEIIAADIVEDLQAALAQFAEWSERDERHRRKSDEGRSERARAANEFQIAADLKR